MKDDPKLLAGDSPVWHEEDEPVPVRETDIRRLTHQELADHAATLVIGDLHKEIAMLKAALKPFADYGESLPADARPDYPMNDAGSREGRVDIPTVRDCLFAVAAYRNARKL